MNYTDIIGKTITIDGEKFKVYDSCRPCRRLWAETKDERVYIKVDRWENYKIVERKVKQLV